MRTVAYLRVSTVRQADRGRSLEDQKRRVHAWAERGGHTLVAAPYTDAESAWSRRGPDGKMRESAEARASFARMITEFSVHRPECVLVDTLDRWSRTLREGLNTLELLRGHGVGLLPLDWDRDTPIDVDNDSDWASVVRFFVAAEEENRSRSRRMKRSWEGRRARKAPMRNVPPFGLIRDGDVYLPGPGAWIVKAIDERYLAGEPIADIQRWAIAVTTRENAGSLAWRSRHGLRYALLSSDYVRAGVRAPETAQKIRALMEGRKTHHGARRKYPHEFTGVFACGRCIELGFPPAGSLMGQALKWDVKLGARRAIITCQGASVLGRRHQAVTVSVSRIAEAWISAVDSIAYDPSAVEEWAHAAPVSEARAKEQRLHSEIAKTDQEEAALATRRKNVFAFHSDTDPGVVAQVRQALLELDQDQKHLQVRRGLLNDELASIARVPRDPAVLRTVLERYSETYRALDASQRNLLNRLLCNAVESHPVIARSANHGWATITLSWEGVLREPLQIHAVRSSPGEGYDAKRRSARFARGRCTRCGVRPLKDAMSPKTGEPYKCCEECLAKGTERHLQSKAQRANRDGLPLSAGA